MNVKTRSYAVILLFMMWPMASVSQPVQLQQTNFEDLPALQASASRPVLIYLTAEWCTYCRQVENTSFKNEGIINKLNQDFWFIRFDIEERKNVRLGGRIYSFKPTGVDTGVHELADFLGSIDGVLSTPTFIILSSSFEILYRYGGFLDSTQIKAMLDAV